MALTIEQLQELLKGEGLKYFIAPEHPALLLPMEGLFGRYQITASLQTEGRFFQLRTVGYLSCPASHASLPAVLRTLASINYSRRLVKFGWDERDGEIMAYADVWLMDAGLTQSQLHRIMGNFLPVIDLEYRRLAQCIETGKDPGETEYPQTPPTAPQPTPAPGGEVKKI